MSASDGVRLRAVSFSLDNPHPLSKPLQLTFGGVFVVAVAVRRPLIR